MINNWLKAFTHNYIVHPLMMFVPRQIGDKMHDRNANWAFSLNRYDELALERKAEMDKRK
jgi:hypothetical protein